MVSSRSESTSVAEADALVATLEVADGWGAANAAVAVVGPDGTIAKFGPTRRRFRIASVSKPLVAMAILLAVEEGALTLDDPAGPPGSTVRHLLSHAGGYGFTGPSVLAAPGTRRIYSNQGFDDLGDVLSATTDMSTAAYLREGVFLPLGMRDSALEGSPAKDIHATVDDLALFARDLLRPTLLAPSSMAALTTVQFPTLAGVLPDVGRFDPNPWGLGVEIRGAKQPHWTGTRNAASTFGHFGGSGTFLWVDPAVDLAVVCLTDREFGPWALTAWPALSDAVLRHHQA